MIDSATHASPLGAEAPRLRLSPSRQFAVLSLAILLLLGGLLAWFLSGQIERQMASAASDMIGHQVTTMIRTQLTTDDLREPMTGDRYRAFDDFLRQNILSRQIARVKIWNEAGTIIYADDPALVGQTFPLGDELREVYAEGEVTVELASLQKPENVAEEGMGRLLEIYVPLVPRDSEEVLGYTSTTSLSERRCGARKPGFGGRSPPRWPGCGPACFGCSSAPRAPLPTSGDWPLPIR